MDLTDLAVQVKPGSGDKTFRIGVCTAKQTTTITVDGDKTLRFLGVLADYTTTKQVVWVNDGDTPFVLGQLL